LYEQPSVLLSGCASRKQNAHGRLKKELAEQNFIPVLLPASIETSFDFPEDKEDQKGNEHLFARCEPISQGGIALKKVGQAVGVQRGSHFHFS
jgi:hypothetical protein